MRGEEALGWADHDGDDLAVQLWRRATDRRRRVGCCRFVQGLAPVQRRRISFDIRTLYENRVGNIVISSVYRFKHALAVELAVSLHTLCHRDT